MTNFMMFMVFMYISAVSLSFMMDGSMGPAATMLTADITATSTTVPVHSTANFLNNDFVVIGDEKICYTTRGSDSFTDLTRGCRNTTAEAHDTNTKVYNEPASLANQVIGFDLLDSVADQNVAVAIIKGAIALPGVVKNVFTKLVMWDFAYLEASQITYIKFYVLYPISAGFVISIVLFVRKVTFG